VYDPIPGCCETSGDCDDGNVCTVDGCPPANVASVDLTAASGDYVDLGQDTTPDNYINNFGTSSFTVEGWFYARSVPADYTGVFRAGQQGAFPQVAIQLRTGTTPWITTSVERNAGSGTAQVDAPLNYAANAAVTLNAWHHVALVLDRSASQLRTYLDGALISTAAVGWATTDTVNMPAGQASILGAARGTTQALFGYHDGYLDEIRIWSYARTGAEIAAEMGVEIASAPGLVHRWGFNEASGPAIDEPGTFDGTFVGGATRSTTVWPTLGDNQCD
jgi:hypothetical protein